MKNEILAFLKSKGGIFMLVALCCALILLLLGSGAKEETKEKNISVNITTEEYEKDIESRLTAMISAIEGTSDVRVMVTVDCGVEYVYAQNIETSEQNEKSEYYSAGDDDALLLKELRPKVRGVAVVCRGGDDIAMQKKIIELVSGALQLSSGRIFVGA